VSVHDVLELLEAVTTWANTPESELDREPTIDNAASIVRAIQQARRALSLAEDVYAEFLHDTAGRGLHEQYGPPFEVRVGANRKTWDHAAVVASLVPRIAERLELHVVVNSDGEAMSSVDVVAAIVASFREASSDGWKVTGLRAFGLDPDEYAETSRGRVSVSFP